MMNWFLVFVAVLSVARGTDRVTFLGSLLDKVMNIGQDLSGMMAKSSGKLEYLGCYYDDGDRMLDDEHKYLIFNLTLEWCFAYCGEGNYRYAAVQNSEECFCGNTIDTEKYPKKPDSECRMKCSGNAIQICGDKLRNSLYKLY